jgi:hypothetical protein
VLSSPVEVSNRLTHDWQINEWLSQKLEPGWDATRHWTSRNRNQIYPNNPFLGKEGDFTDFTYQDTSGKLTELLTTHGFIKDVETWLKARQYTISK